MEPSKLRSNYAVGPCILSVGGVGPFQSTYILAAAAEGFTDAVLQSLPLEGGGLNLTSDAMLGGRRHTAKSEKCWRRRESNSYEKFPDSQRRHFSNSMNM